MKESSFPTALSVPVMPHPSTALDMLAAAGQPLHKNCPAGRAGGGGERMQEENIVGEREFEEKTWKERGTEE